MYIPYYNFKLQWHITDCCNLRCTHCYEDSYKCETDFENLIKYFIQFKELIDFFNENSEEVVRPLLSITGGEPLLAKHFWDFAEILAYHSKVIEYSLLTNGTLLTKEAAQRLKEYGINRIQISIDGDEAAHDKIRGNGNFQKALKGLKNAIGAGLHTTVSFTAHKENYKVFPKVVDIAKNIGADFVWSDRLIPEGSGSNLLCMSKSETQDYIKMLEQERVRLESENEKCKTIVKNHRALQFLANPDELSIYQCGAGDRLLTLLSNGDVYPCRRMPVYVGNLNKETLKDIYCKNEFVLKLQEHKIPKACEACEYKNDCRGGLKCLVYAKDNTLKTPDEGCWLAKN